MRGGMTMTTPIFLKFSNLEVSQAVAQSFVGVCLSRQMVYGYVYADRTFQTRGYLAPVSTCSDPYLEASLTIRKS